MAETAYDRTTQDLGNIVNLGHVNVQVADQRLATAYYVSALGFTRDPFLVTGIDNMWVNVGMSQFHLPTASPQVVQGLVGLVVPDREELLERLAAAKKTLAGTKFDYRETNDAVETTCPWGNRIDCHAPDKARFGRMGLGMAYVEFDAPAGSAPKIARFYSEILHAPADVVDRKGAPCARVPAGEKQYLYFRETENPRVPYDDNHIQVYIQDFSGPYRELLARGLVTQESNEHQFRFKDILDLDSGEPVYRIDHEVRSMLHPMYQRPLINRNPAVTLRAYDPGKESRHWTV